MSEWEKIDPEVIESARAGDGASVIVVMESLLPFIGSKASAMVIGSHREMDDLRQAGLVGLLEALRTFDPDRGVFESWAYFSISREMAHELQRTKMGAAVPQTQAEKFFRVMEASDQDPALAREMAPEFGMTERTFLDLLEAMSSMDEPSSVSSEDFSDDVATRVLAESLLDTLEQMDREIVVLYFGLGGQAPMTDSEIGEIVGLHRTNVNIRRRKALLVMREGR